MKVKMKADKILLIIAVVAVVSSFVSTGFTYFSVIGLFNQISGYATTGEANLTVETLAEVNFTTSLIDWGSGLVDTGETSAQLLSFGSNNVSGGNWTLQTGGGLAIINSGNVNVSLNLSVGKNASEFIGGTTPGYEWNISEVEGGSCTATGLGVWRHANTTDLNSGGGFDCTLFRFEAANDQIRIDFNLTIPEDSSTGALTDTITATVNTL
jgi:predicted secreted protein